MDIEKIESLIEILEGTDVTELAVEEEDIKIKIRKGPESVETVQYAPQSSGQAAVSPEIKEEKETGAAEDEKAENGGDTINAPMVGTFYRAPAPDADPFVEVGDVVDSGTTLCIIEAMKLMNEIEAERTGRIVEILVDDGEPIEYGQPLFKIEKV